MALFYLMEISEQNLKDDTVTSTNSFLVGNISWSRDETSLQQDFKLNLTENIVISVLPGFRVTCMK